ncbi:MAG: hypothetical protein JNL28_17605 [Planctomycetes bacterium]|nr:hypothetical protein [Planctomycetota bacterium]
MNDGSDKRIAFALLVFAAALIAFEIFATVRVPFISEDWTHLHVLRPVESLSAALDPRLEPLRPFQHGFFWVLSHSGLDPAATKLPIMAHTFAWTLHAISCLCVFLLARAAGARGVGAWTAMALFAAFPNVKCIAWSAAIGSPGRVCFELIALTLFVKHLTTPRPLLGAFGLAAFFLALGWHESAMMLAPVLVLWIVFMNGRTLREGLAQLRTALRDPWIVAFCACATAYVVYLFLRPTRHHQAKDLDALPANVVKATTALLPQDLRTMIVEGFRGTGGAAGSTLAWVLFACIALGALALFRRSRTARFVLSACALELGLPALGTGFVQRYAIFASALVALGLGLWIARHGGVWRGVLVLLLGMTWTRDSVVDAGDFKQIGERIPVWTADLRRLREATGPNIGVAIVNPPDMWGAEADIPLFNWGLDFMLEARHIPGPWLLWRTVPYRTSSVVELVDESRLEAARRTGVPRLYEFHSIDRR